MFLHYLVLLVIIGTTMLVTVRIKKLTPPASVAGGIIGILIFTAASFTGVAMMAVFFITGTAATSWKSRTKNKLGIAEENQGRRTAAQVFANAGVAALIAVYACLLPEKSGLFQLMIAASFAGAAGDTLSSELGNVYGSRYYNILTMKKDQRGLNGVVSLEGTLAGLAGSMLIAAVYCIGFGWSIYFLWIIIAGMVGNLVDSLLGATVERRRYIDNDVVNFLNTLASAITALALA